MPQVQIDDQVFQAAQRRAADDGYSSVEAYITAADSAMARAEQERMTELLDRQGFPWDGIHLRTQGDLLGELAALDYKHPKKS